MGLQLPRMIGLSAALKGLLSLLSSFTKTHTANTRANIHTYIYIFMYTRMQGKRGVRVLVCLCSTSCCVCATTFFMAGPTGPFWQQFWIVHYTFTHIHAFVVVLLLFVHSSRHIAFVAPQRSIHTPPLWLLSLLQQQPTKRAISIHWRQSDWDDLLIQNLDFLALHKRFNYLFRVISVMRHRYKHTRIRVQPWFPTLWGC